MTFSSVLVRGARWTPVKLMTLRGALNDGMSLSSAGSIIGHTRQECDLAMWALLGRSLPQACDMLNGRRGR